MEQEVFSLIDKLNENHSLDKGEWVTVIEGQTLETLRYAATLACNAREPYYGKKVFLRGLIEFTNYCKNNCYYCGIQRENKNVRRYRLSEDEILECCRTGDKLGFKTFVLQGGEDLSYSDEKICSIVRRIKSEFPNCAVTLSIGEKTKESYALYREAGTDRYLLRHETADTEHYKKLHPAELDLENRKKCLYALRELGYQVGAGFMVGSPYQTSKTLAEDMLFLRDLNPAMVGIGPFIPHHDTRFADYKAGSVDQTLYLLSLIRIMLPRVLLPATTALGTIDPFGREKGMQAGANVLMPNLSPGAVRKDYLLYDNKICTGEESAECSNCIEVRMKHIGYEVVYERGDSLNC